MKKSYNKSIFKCIRMRKTARSPLNDQRQEGQCRISRIICMAVHCQRGDFSRAEKSHSAVHEMEWPSLTACSFQSGRLYSYHISASLPRFWLCTPTIHLVPAPALIRDFHERIPGLGISARTAREDESLALKKGCLELQLINFMQTN